MRFPPLLVVSSQCNLVGTDDDSARRYDLILLASALDWYCAERRARHGKEMSDAAVFIDCACLHAQSHDEKLWSEGYTRGLGHLDALFALRATVKLFLPVRAKDSISELRYSSQSRSKCRRRLRGGKPSLRLSCCQVKRASLLLPQRLHRSSPNGGKPRRARP